MVRLKGIKVRVVPSGQPALMLSTNTLSPDINFLMAAYTFGVKELPVQFISFLGFLLDTKVKLRIKYVKLESGKANSNSFGRDNCFTVVNGWLISPNLKTGSFVCSVVNIF